MHKDSWSIRDPVAAEEEGRKVTMEEVQRGTHLCEDWIELVDLIEEYADIGVTAFALETGADKKRIREIAENVLRVF